MIDKSGLPFDGGQYTYYDNLDRGVGLFKPKGMPVSWLSTWYEVNVFFRLVESPAQIYR